MQVILWKNTSTKSAWRIVYTHLISCSFLTVSRTIPMSPSRGETIPQAGRSRSSKFMASMRILGRRDEGTGYDDLLADFELMRGWHDASLVVAHLQLMALVGGETLLAFKAGRAFRREGTNIVEPSPVKGAIYITNGEDGLLHFVWKDRVTNNIEEVRFSISLHMVVSCIWDSRTLYYFLSTHRSWRWIKWPRVEYMSSSSRLLIKDISWVLSCNCTTLFINLSSFS